MRSVIQKISASILLVLSVVFACLSTSALPSLVTPVFAEPGTSTGHIDYTDDEPPATEPDDTDDTDTPDGSTGTITYPDDDTHPEDPDGGDADGDGSDDDDDSTSTENNVCTQETGLMSWVVCPFTSLIASATDGIYALIGDFLVINPISMEDSSPVYTVWKYMLGLTNTLFVIALVIIIYSQITGFGINNYGIKRVLPRLILVVVLANLSYFICTIAIDLSNITGESLRGFFENIQNNMLADVTISDAASISLSTLVSVILGGGVVGAVAISATGGLGHLFWMLVPILLGAVISVVAGLITIAARQAVVILLVMISPLAFVAYLLPNTEVWFSRWKNLFTRMIVFYPLFSFLFAASQLAGWALIASASGPLGIVIGLGVQIFPLFFSVSLMRMSGTFLSNINNGVRKISDPIQRGVAGWAVGHRERSRQTHIAYSESSGARLRRYLDYRRELRDTDTRNALDTRRSRAIERALTEAASITGRDEKGNTTWETRPNHYTRNAKTANFYATRAGTARAAYMNTLTGYGRHFTDAQSQHLSDQHGEAFLDAMAQQFLTANEAQADQEWLLNRYLKATTTRRFNAYEYNRLIKDAAGGLGHNGESSIMGQVIVNSSNIENRRRSEARIIATKFGVSKTKMRGMVFDKANINDNGYETDENGTPIEDTQYRLIEYDKDGNPTGFRRRKWQHYIGVHKTTGAEITKAEYDALSAEEQKNYNRVRYFDITDDNGNPVQRVFDDDAGYMKELLRDDIAIGDPINRRYLTEVGVAHAEGEKTGILRRYHSTVAAAMLETKYKEHAAEVTPMITAQANAGYITSIGQYNIANLQSLSVASKAGSFLQNDSYAFNDWAELVKCTFDDALFAKYFTDNDVANYRNVNGVHLDGMRWDEDAQAWIEINHNDPSITLEDKKNCIKHKIIPKAAAKLVGMLNRDISPSVLDSMKPDNLKALKNLLGTLAEVGVENFAEDRAPEDRLQGDMNIFDSSDPKILKSQIINAQAYIDDLLENRTDDGGSDGDEEEDEVGGPILRTPNTKIQRQGLRLVQQRVRRKNMAEQHYMERTNITNIIEVVKGYFGDGISVSASATNVRDYLTNNDRFKENSEAVREIEEIIEKYTTVDDIESAENRENFLNALINWLNTYHSD